MDISPFNEGGVQLFVEIRNFVELVEVKLVGHLLVGLLNLGSDHAQLIEVVMYLVEKETHILADSRGLFFQRFDNFQKFCELSSHLSDCRVHLEFDRARHIQDRAY